MNLFTNNTEFKINGDQVTLLETVTTMKQHGIFAELRFISNSVVAIVMEICSSKEFNCSFGIGIKLSNDASPLPERTWAIHCRHLIVSIFYLLFYALDIVIIRDGSLCLSTFFK